MSDLYQHQIDGAAWLAARTRGYLGDVPGLGKTRTLLAASGAEPGALLVVCPAIVRTHWLREAALVGTGAPIVKSYDEIVRGGVPLMRELLVKQKVTKLIADEVHYCKHATSQRARLLLGKDGYARRMECVYVASGTPVSKNPLEFGTVLLSLFPEVAIEHGLPTLADVRDRFCVVEQEWVRGKLVDKVLPVIRNEEEFKQILSQVMLRRTLDDVGIDVPPLDWQLVRLDGPKLDVLDELRELNGSQTVIPEALRNNLLEEIARDPHVARMRRRLGELKIAPAAELILSSIADGNEKIVVFAHHKIVMESLHTRLKGQGVAYIDGSTTPKQRDEAIDRFQNDPTCRVFLGQNIACQTGITLTAARRVVLVEPDWTADVNVQLGKRIARIGQRADRCVGQMIALAGTLDEGIVAHNQRETRLAEDLGLGDTCRK